MHRVSIITINLNNRAGLQKTMASVLSQTFADYEYIIIDGGSTDGSLDVIKQFEDQINFWVSEKDNGIYNAMNKGIRQAKSEYCLFMNSGDYLYSKDSLLKLLSNSFAEDIVYWNFLLTKSNRRKKIIQPPKLTPSFLYLYAINHQSCLIKRDLFDRFGLYNENLRIVSDRLFFLNTIIQGKVATKHLNLVLTIYNGDGISKTNNLLAQQENESIINGVFPDWIREDYERLNKYDSIVGMLDKTGFNRTVTFIFKSLNKIIKFFWLNKREYS